MFKGGKFQTERSQYSNCLKYDDSKQKLEFLQKLKDQSVLKFFLKHVYIGKGNYNMS